MKDSKKRTLLIHVIGMFVARAAFYNMNPLAIGYFTAALIANTGGKMAFLAITIGIMTAMPITRALKYLLTMITTLVILEIPMIKKRKIPQIVMYAILRPRWASIP